MRNSIVRDSQYRTLCCHVKSATLAWGFLNVILQLIILASFTLVLINPQYLKEETNSLDTPLGLKDTPYSLFNEKDIFQTYRSKIHNPYVNFKVHNINIEDAHIGLLITLCAFLITTLLIHGTISGKPGYLIPFFSLQIFDLCLTVLTFLGYYTYSPNFKQYLENDKSFPFQEQFTKINSNYLSISTFVLFMFVVTFKVYFIHVVWSCYKYLSLKKAALKINYIKVEHETTSLPDYETAVKMPPADLVTPPPPQYTQ